MNPDQQAYVARQLPLQSVRAHLVLAKLIEDGQLNWDELFIRSRGTRSRAYLKEVTRCAYEKVNVKQKVEKLIVDLNQEGLYDMLPNGLFHPQVHSDAYDSINTYIEESRQRKQQEAAARTFFLPFEQEPHRLRILIQQLENRNIETLHNPMINRVFQGYTQSLPGGLDGRVLNIINYLLPLAHEIAMDPLLIQECYAAILGERVEVRPLSPPVSQAPHSLIPRLGRAILGLDMVLGDEVQHPVKVLQLAIGPLRREKAIAFLPGSAKVELIEWVRRFFVPFEYEVQARLILARNEADFQLDSDYLGLTTMLN